MSSPLGALALVAGAAVVAAALADGALPLTGHETVSVHAGRHPRVTLLMILATGAALATHFNIRWIRQRATAQFWLDRRKGSTRP